MSKELENAIKKEYGLTDKQFYKLFGAVFDKLDEERVLRKIRRDTRLVRYKVIKK